MTPLSLPVLLFLLAAQPGQTQPYPPSPAPHPPLSVTVGQSIIVDSPVHIQRVSVANGDLAEALAVSPRELLVNGKSHGETTLIVWEQGGSRTIYDLSILPNQLRVEAIQRRIEAELPGQPIRIAADRDALFLTGTAADASSAARAAVIAGVLGKIVNLLNVKVPAADPQILLKVRFANVDRVAARELGANILSTGALNTTASLTTGTFAPPKIETGNGGNEFSISDALNVFLFRRDINLGAVIRALASRQLLEILAEPNVLAIDGRPASFVSGGEFPFPTVQGGNTSPGAVTIQFREFGVRINFLPHVTPRGTIRLQVVPEVSSLDYANGLTYQGFHIPALATRRVQTEVELASGQSFLIAGLMDNRLTDSISKVPGLGDIPLLGKIFRSQTVTRNRSELLVLVTPELVQPIPENAPVPDMPMPQPFLKGDPLPQSNPKAAALPQTKTIPIESLDPDTTPSPVPHPRSPEVPPALGPRPPAPE